MIDTTTEIASGRLISCFVAPAGKVGEVVAKILSTSRTESVRNEWVSLLGNGRVVVVVGQRQRLSNSTSENEWVNLVKGKSDGGNEADVFFIPNFVLHFSSEGPEQLISAVFFHSFSA